MAIFVKRGPPKPIFRFSRVIFWKTALTIFFIFCMKLEANIALILAKTVCSGKFWFRSYGPKRTDFGKIVPFSYGVYLGKFKRAWHTAISTVSTYRHSFTPKIGADSVPKPFFSIFSNLDGPIILKLSSQIRAYNSENFRSVPFSVLVLWPFL